MGEGREKKRAFKKAKAAYAVDERNHRYPRKYYFCINSHAATYSHENRLICGFSRPSSSFAFHRLIQAPCLILFSFFFKAPSPGESYCLSCSAWRTLFEPLTPFFFTFVSLTLISLLSLVFCVVVLVVCFIYTFTRICDKAVSRLLFNTQ